jgi:hypothetical protein
MFSISIAYKCLILLPTRSNTGSAGAPATASCTDGKGIDYIDYEWLCMCNEEDDYYAQTINIMNTSLTH